MKGSNQNMGKPAILCIDDEKIVLDSLRDQIKGFFKDGIKMEFAENAQEGLEILEEMKEDGQEVKVILSDWNMPGMSGDEFFLKIGPEYPEIKKILLSGEPDPDIINRAKSKDYVSKLIQKPWNSKELLGLLEEFLK